MSDRKQKRRRQILAAAREVFAEKGFVGSNVDDITARVEVARGTFYLYFDDKLDVFRTLVNEFYDRIAGCIVSIDLGAGDTPRAQLRANLARVVAAARKDRGMVGVAMSTAMGVDPRLDEELESFYGMLRTLLDETLETGQTIGLVRAGDRRPMVSMALGGFRGLLLSAERGEGPQSDEELVEALMGFLEHGLLAR